ncbi:CU044_2847 family protein [Methylocapsa acidiphila]|uniref:CU044_2847 family protein n=1 Tax=Methylocapsa acidiphila TaxID=133552 RepID=UPI0004010ED0|nr:CU044_2847 family protein [Methylocapsa acidiphila]
MTALLVVELSDDKRLFFGGRGPDGELSEVWVTDEIAKGTRDSFQSALGALAELVKTLDASVAGMEGRPEKVEIEFGASLGSDCNLWIAPGDSKAEFKVKLTWSKA